MSGSPGSSRKPAARDADAVRFTKVELYYGRHEGTFELGVSGRPFVIAGPNGSGKSSLVEGLVRTLYGFRRAKREEREIWERRRPWRGGTYAGRLWLETRNGSWSFERDFDSDRVRVVAPGADSPRFEGEANPTRVGASVRRYRALLEESVGLSKLDDYRRTACVFQGGLPATSLSLDLLRVAAGGHADVDTARERLRDEYRELTLEPIGEGVGRRRTPGAIETLEGRIGEHEADLREAREAERRRGPLLRQREELERRLKANAEERGRLDRAFETLSEAARLEEAAESSRSRIRRLEGWTRELDEALARYDLARERHGADPRPAYPDDFLERARALDAGLWPRRDELQAEREAVEATADEADRRVGSWGAAVTVALGATAVAFWLAGAAALAGLALGLAIAACAFALVARRSAHREREARARSRGRVEAELARVEERIAALLEDVPDAGGLDAGTLVAARDRFEREAADRALVENCRQALRAALDQASRALNELWDDEARATRSESVPGGLAERARDRLSQLHEAAARERDESLAPIKLELASTRRVRFELPSGVEPTLEGVRAARHRSLEEGEKIREDLSAVERDLAAGARPRTSSLVLETELARARDELAGLEERAEAYRAAYRLLGDAYDAFRRMDEERLVGAISARLSSVSRDLLGPLDVSSGLEDAQIEIGGRAAPIDAPPLSFGQLHTALLAIRMGAADFLAGLGLRVPLLIDDPFVHLDEHLAADLWTVLSRVAEERQVIVATQDRLILEHLGIEPDLALGKDASGSGAPEARASSEPAPGSRASDAGRTERGDAGRSRLGETDDARDLWSQSRS